MKNVENIDYTEADGKGKLIYRLEIADKEFDIVKLFHLEDTSYDEAMEDVKQCLNEMLADGIPEGSNRKVKYLIDGRLKEETKKVRQEN